MNYVADELANIAPYDDLVLQSKLISGNLTLSEHTDSCFASIEQMKNMNFAEADKPFIK